MFCPPTRREATLLGAAAAALAVGLLVYLADRPAGTAWLLPPVGTPHGLPSLGAAAAWLPSAVHVFAFALLSALVLPPHRLLGTTACAGWVLVDMLFELGQHRAIAAPLSQWLQAHLPSQLAQPLARYFLAGTFDPADLAAAVLGGAMAWLVIRRTDGTTENLHGA